MKTLVTTVAVLFLLTAAVPAKEGAFVSVIVTDKDQPTQVRLTARQWIKITNFVQNGGNTDGMAAGVAVFQGTLGMWVLFANDPATTNEPVIIAGPATVVVSIPSNDVRAFLTYQRGSD